MFSYRSYLHSCIFHLTWPQPTKDHEAFHLVVVQVSEGPKGISIKLGWHAHHSLNPPVNEVKAADRARPKHSLRKRAYGPQYQKQPQDDAQHHGFLPEFRHLELLHQDIDREGQPGRRQL